MIDYSNDINNDTDNDNDNGNNDDNMDNGNNIIVNINSQGNYLYGSKHFFSSIS